MPKWIIETFGRTIGLFLCLGQVILFAWLKKKFAPDWPDAVLGATSVLGALLAVAEIELLSRAAGGGPVMVDLRTRVGRLQAGGGAVALLLAIVLAALAFRDQAADQRWQPQEEADRAALRHEESDPNVQRGQEALRRFQEKRQNHPADQN